MAFSGFFTILNPPPVITSTDLIAKTGDTVVISGRNFKYNINQISGRNIYDSSLDFYYFSGLNNTITEDAVTFTIPAEVNPSKYQIFVYNESGISDNFVNLTVVGAPAVSGFDTISGTPSEYIRVSGSFYPGATIKLIDESGITYTPIQDTGLYRVSYVLPTEFAGTGYSTGTTYAITGQKLFESNSSGSIQIISTGISGSIYEVSVIDSGAFTVIESTSGLFYSLPLINPNTNETGLINLYYEKYTNTGAVDFIEFKVPENINGLHSGIIENIRYKEEEASIATGLNIIGIPIIFGFEPLTGNVEEQNITLSGQNFSFVEKVFLGSKEISFTKINDTGINFIIPNLVESDYITVSGSYGVDTSDLALNVNYPNIFASGFYPNNILLGTGAIISISGKYLQRINYIDLGTSKILRPNITINTSGTSGSFSLPDTFKTSEITIFSLDFSNSGFLIESIDTNNKLIASSRLNEKNINFRYLSGIQGAKYLDEIEFFTSSFVSGDYGNLSGIDVFFLSSTGNRFITGDYSISGIKVQDSSTGVKIKIPREVKNPQCPIKIKRNRFGDEYLLSSAKQIDILPSIYDFDNNITASNTGELIISGINASNVNQIFFSGSNLKDAFGFKDISYAPVDILSKDLNQITGFENGNLTGYTIIRGKLGGDYVGGGKLFLFHEYYDTGIGYENINADPTIFLAARISGYRPKDSDIFTSEKIINTALDRSFFYNIKTNTDSNIFEVYPSTEFGADNPIPNFLNRLNIFHNGINIISGSPVSGGNYYLKIKALNGSGANEGMLLQINVGNASGRQVDVPGIVYQGDWQTGFRYIGDSSRRDVVFYDLLSSGTSGIQTGSRYWYAARNSTGIAPALTGSGSVFWVQFSNEFNATATKILLAEESNITNSLNIGRGGTFSGFIKTVNDINCNTGSGFFLGYDNTFNSGLAKFRVGNTGNYIKFDGLGLDIVGPLSGVITTSRKVENTNNQVKSEYSVSVGFNNIIETGSDNSMVIGSNNLVHENTKNTFIFGESNIATGGERIAISAGSENIITGTEEYLSFDSNILGGKQNLIFGSYSNIVGGKNNYIDSVTSGYNSISDTLFDSIITGLSGSGSKSQFISYPKSRTNDNLSVLNSIEVKCPILTGNNIGLSGIDASGFIFRQRFSADTTGIIKRQSILNIKISGLDNKQYGIIYDNPISFDTGRFTGVASGIVSGLVTGSTYSQSGNSIFAVGIGTGILFGTITGSGIYNIGTGYFYNNLVTNAAILAPLYGTGILSSTTTGLSGLYSFIDIVSGVGSLESEESRRDKYGRIIENSGILGLLVNGTGFNTRRVSGVVNDSNQFISGGFPGGQLAVRYVLPRENDFANNFNTEFIGYYSGTTLGTTRQSSGIYFYFYSPEQQIPTGSYGNASGLGYQVEFSPINNRASIYWGNNRIPLVSGHVVSSLNQTSTSLTSWPITGKITFETGIFNVYINNEQVITGYRDPQFTLRDKTNRAFGYGGYGAEGSLNLIRNIKFDVGPRSLNYKNNLFKGLISPFYKEAPYYDTYFGPRARINYNMGSTGVFHRFSGEFYTNNIDATSFYWYAKGTVNPNTNTSTGDSFPMLNYNNAPDFDGYRLVVNPSSNTIDLNWNSNLIGSVISTGLNDWTKISFIGNNQDFVQINNRHGYRVHFEEWGGNPPLAISWNGYTAADGYSDPAPYGQEIARISSLPFNFGDNIWRTIKVEYDNKNFNVYVDNTLYLTASDSSPRDLSNFNFGLGGYIGGFNNYHYFKNFRLYDDTLVGSPLVLQDILNSQSSTIGSLHYDAAAGVRTIFTTDGSDKVVRNETLNSANRINYTTGSFPNKFTAIFDFKAGGGNGADGGFFYFFNDMPSIAGGPIGKAARIPGYTGVSLNIYQNDNFLGQIIDPYTGTPPLPPRLLTDAYDPSIWWYNIYEKTIAGINANSRNMGLNLARSSSDYSAKKCCIQGFKFTGVTPSNTIQVVDDLRQNQIVPTGALHVSTGRALNSSFGYEEFYINGIISGLITGREGRFITGPGQITEFSSGVLDLNNLFHYNSAGARVLQKTPFVTGMIGSIYSSMNELEPYTNIKYIVIPLNSEKDFINDTVGGNRSSYTISAWVQPHGPSNPNVKNAKDVTGNFADMQTLISFCVPDSYAWYANPNRPGLPSHGLYVGLVETSGGRDIVNPGTFKTAPFPRFSYGGDSLTTLSNYSLDSNPAIAVNPYTATGSFLFGSYNGFIDSYDINKQNNFGYVDDVFRYPNLEVKYVHTEESGRFFTTGTNIGAGERNLSDLENINYPTYGVSSRMMLSSGAWNHVVYSYEKIGDYQAKYRYYINGTLRASGYYADIGDYFGPSTHNDCQFIVIGATPLLTGGSFYYNNPSRYAMGNGFNGYIGEIRIDNYAITGLRYNVPTSLSDDDDAIFYINASKIGYKSKEKNKTYPFVTTTGYGFVVSPFEQIFYTGRYYQNIFNLRSWINNPLENIYSGSFERSGDSSPLEFSIFKSGFAPTDFTFADSSGYKAPVIFRNEFTGFSDPSFKLICLYNIYGKEDYARAGNYYQTGIEISGLSHTGFWLISNQLLDHNITGNFYIGRTGLYTGISDNSGQIFEINSVYLSGSRPDLNGDNFILSGSGLIPINRYLRTQKPIRIFGNAYCEAVSGARGMKVIDNYNFVYITGSNPQDFYIKLSASGLKTADLLTADFLNKNPKLTGLKFDYILTDLEVDYLSLKRILGESAFGRISAIGFDDVGSSSIFGGTGNYIKGLVNTIGGGIQNRIIGDYNTIPGGRSNIIMDEPATNIPPQVYFSTILGGNFNKISGNVVDATILGGEDNLIINNAREENSEMIGGSILGGRNNLLSGSFSAIIGGADNIISGNYAYGLGRNIINRNSGAMVLADGTTNISGKTSLSQNALTLHFNSGVYITGVGTGAAPIIIALNSIPVGATNVPIGGLYRVGTALNIRIS